MAEPKSRKSATERALVSCFVHRNSPQARVPGKKRGKAPAALEGQLLTSDLTPAEILELEHGCEVDLQSALELIEVLVNRLRNKLGAGCIEQGIVFWDIPETLVPGAT